MARAVGFEPTPEVLETSLYGFEDRCATVTLSPYIWQPNLVLPRGYPNIQSYLLSKLLANHAVRFP